MLKRIMNALTVARNPKVIEAVESLIGRTPVVNFTEKEVNLLVDGVGEVGPMVEGKENATVKYLVFINNEGDRIFENDVSSVHGIAMIMSDGQDKYAVFNTTFGENIKLDQLPTFEKFWGWQFVE